MIFYIKYLTHTTYVNENVHLDKKWKTVMVLLVVPLQTDTNIWPNLYYTRKKLYDTKDSNRISL